MMRILIAAIMMLWSLPALAFFSQIAVNGAGGVAPPTGTPTYYLYGF